MTKNKTTETANSVTGFIRRIDNERKRIDSFDLIEVIHRETGFEPRMWGPSIVGFGRYHYKYGSGHEGDAPLVGFSPRKNAIVLYLSANFKDREALLQQLGKYKTGKGCVYISKLSDIDMEVLKKLVNNSVDHVKAMYP